LQSYFEGSLVVEVSIQQKELGIDFDFFQDIYSMLVTISEGIQFLELVISPVATLELLDTFFNRLGIVETDVTECFSLKYLLRLEKVLLLEIRQAVESSICKVKWLHCNQSMPCVL
jgi:hypothetical protein